MKLFAISSIRATWQHAHVALLVGALALACGAVWAQTRIDGNGVSASGSVIGDDVLYSIGGGRAVSMGSAGNMQSIGVGVGWNSNLICGDMSITTTLQNQLNGITNGFQTIMSNVIQNATAAVASLPALIIQRADPGLYNLLTNGILQARLDFDRSKMTCRAIANRMADMAGGQTGWDQLAEGMALKDAVASTDAVSAVEQAETNRGNNGVPWVGGGNAGGSGQGPVRVVGDVTRAGYNLLNGRGVTDTSSIDRNTCGNRLTCQTWSSPQAAADWATRVLGEREQRTCESCTKTQTTPGVGLTPLIQEEYETKLQALQELITRARPTTVANLDAAGSVSLPITRGVIEALRDEPDQDVLGKRLASEVALASVLEKALLLQRTLLTGKKEPNVAANELATRAVDQENSTLEQEINNLKTELELRRDLAGNSAMSIIQRHGTRATSPFGGCSSMARRRMAGSGCAGGCSDASRPPKPVNAWCAPRSPPWWRSSSSKAARCCKTGSTGRSAMTLYTTDYLEYYLTLVGWIVNNGIWSILVASGIFALPFLAIVIHEWLRARTEGADEGNKGVLSAMRIENRVWVAIVVILFAGIPFIPVDLSTIQFDRTRSTQCQVNVPKPGETGWSNAFTTLNNQTAQVPVWWFFMHALSKAVTGAVVAAIPCGTDLRQMRMEIDNTRIGDPVLAQEVADFTHDCYGPARARLFMNRPTLSEEQMSDVSWIGSSYFLNTAGFYDTYRSGTPRTAWPYDGTRDAGLAQVDSGGGYPTCQQWWSSGSEGLRPRLLAQVDPGLLSRLGQWAGFMSQAQVDDSVIRAVASPRQQTMNQGQVYTDYGGQIDKTLPNIVTRGASDLGLTVGSLGLFPAMDVVRQALPMVLSFLKMAMIICIPLVLVIGTYDLKVVVTVSCVQFALFFVDFWFQLARWIDSTILGALYGWNSPHSNFNPLMGLNNAFGDMLLNFVMAAMFIVLPGFWVMAISWAGVRAGNILQGLAGATGDAKSAGGKGAGLAMQAIKK